MSGSGIGVGDSVLLADADCVALAVVVAVGIVLTLPEAAAAPDTDAAADTVIAGPGVAAASPAVELMPAGLTDSSARKSPLVEVLESVVRALRLMSTPASTMAASAMPAAGRSKTLCRQHVRLLMPWVAEELLRRNDFRKTGFVLSDHDRRVSP